MEVPLESHTLLFLSVKYTIEHLTHYFKILRCIKIQIKNSFKKTKMFTYENFPYTYMMKFSLFFSCLKT